MYKDYTWNNIVFLVHEHIVNYSVHEIYRWQYREIYINCWRGEHKLNRGDILGEKGKY